MIDIVFPEKNESKFISMAEKLGYSSLCFIYDYKKNLKKINPSLVLKNGAVYTVDKQSKWAQAIAIADSKIAIVGTNEDVNLLLVLIQLLST